MDYFYTVVIFICILGMVTLSIDVGKNNVLSKSEIKWFRSTFILVAAGSFCEWCGIAFVECPNKLHTLHNLITLGEFSITPMLSVFLARSYRKLKSIKWMSLIMGIHAVFEIIALPFKWVFYIDSFNEFHRGPLYMVYIAACGLAFLYIMVLFVLIGFEARYNGILTTVFITLIMVIGQVACFIDGEIKTGYISIAITAMLLYVYIQGLFRRQIIATLDVEHRIANHDPLTGVSSRISFDRKSEEINDLIQKNPAVVQFALCECDLNNLKMINDTFGHDTGDAYIIRCSRTISNIFKHNQVFRIGGDEFVILIQDDEYINLNNLKEIVKNFTKAEADRMTTLIDKQCFAAGFAVFDNKKDSCVFDVLKRADDEMYKNKKEIKKMLVYK